MITFEVPGVSMARDVVRQFNKHLLNPAMLRLAGSRCWYAAALHHTGRRSGNAYVTPVVADETEDGFIVPLPYGTRVDWLQNVVAARHAILDVHGRTVEVRDPQVLTSAEALRLARPARARQWRLLRIKDFLYLQRVPDEAAPTRVESATPTPGSTAKPHRRRTSAVPPHARPDLRRGNARVHDLVAEVDEAIDAGDEPAVEALSARLHELDPSTGAGANT